MHIYVGGYSDRIWVFFSLCTCYIPLSVCKVKLLILCLQMTFCHYKTVHPSTLS